MTRQISLAEVQAHDKKNSVWIVIHNEVYDVTSFLEEHPGGEDSLLDVAGQDGTQGFEDVGHSDDARELLKKYKIGVLPPEEQNVTVFLAKRSSKCSESSICSKPSCPRLPTNKTEEKTWRTYDGSSTSSYSIAKKSASTTSATTPRHERRVHAIVVPTERRPRGHPCRLRDVAYGPSASFTVCRREVRSFPWRVKKKLSNFFVRTKTAIRSMLGRPAKRGSMS